ncbi:MAG: hypothetical protein AAGE93_25075 [Bacteroidota bacterium]
MIELILITAIPFVAAGLISLIVKFKANRFNAKISFKEAFILFIKKTAKREVFEALAIVQDKNLNLRLMDLEAHYLCKGNPVLLVKTYNKYRNHPVINFQMLSALDLAGENMKKILTNGIPEHKISIINQPIGNLKIDLDATFFFPVSAEVKETDTEAIRQRLISKLEQFGLTWDSTNIKETREFVLSNILNKEYWNKILCLNLVNQNIKVKGYIND